MQAWKRGAHSIMRGASPRKWDRPKWEPPKWEPPKWEPPKWEPPKWERPKRERTDAAAGGVGHLTRVDALCAQRRLRSRTEGGRPRGVGPRG